MDPISFKYTGEPFPRRGPDRVCFVIAVEKAAQRTLRFTHSPADRRVPLARPATFSQALLRRLASTVTVL